LNLQSLSGSGLLGCFCEKKQTEIMNRKYKTFRACKNHTFDSICFEKIESRASKNGFTPPMPFLFQVFSPEYWMIIAKTEHRSSDIKYSK
jgi:hypothetical protein